MLVFINPGHGETDPGTIGFNRTLERDINLIIGLRLSDALTAVGIKNVVEQSDDLDGVCGTANYMDADCFISLHCNGFYFKEPQGIEVCYHPQSQEGYALGMTLLTHLIVATGAVNRGMKDRNKLAVLNQTAMPSILIEMGFLTNPEEEQKLNDSDYQDLIVAAILKGVLEWKEAKGFE